MHQSRGLARCLARVTCRSSSHVLHFVEGASCTHAGARCFECVMRASAGICRYLGHERELSFRLGMRPWIASVLCSGDGCHRGVHHLPDWVRVLLRRYASRHLRYLQLHAGLPSGVHPPTSPRPIAVCLCLVVSAKGPRKET